MPRYDIVSNKTYRNLGIYRTSPDELMGLALSFYRAASMRRHELRPASTPSTQDAETNLNKGKRHLFDLREL
jgi:hypothetical protein